MLRIISAHVRRLRSACLQPGSPTIAADCIVALRTRRAPVRRSTPAVRHGAPANYSTKVIPSPVATSPELTLQSHRPSYAPRAVHVAKPAPAPPHAPAQFPATHHRHIHQSPPPPSSKALHPSRPRRHVGARRVLVAHAPHLLWPGVAQLLTRLHLQLVEKLDCPSVVISKRFHPTIV